MKELLARWSVLLVVSGGLLGCASAGFHDGVYEDQYVKYRVAAPLSGFSRVEVGDNDLAFRRDGYGTIGVNSTCTEYEDVPDVALVNHLLFDTTSRKFTTEETVTLDGRGARHVIARVELDGVPVELELFVMKKDGCVFDLTHVRSVDAPPQVRDVFLALVHSFAVMEVRLP
jgi:hypothetical protein